MPHGTTQKQPSAEWTVEKGHLKPYQKIAPRREERMAYAVRKDNSISFKGNFYSLPLGTYKGKGSKVELVEEEDSLIIYQCNSNTLLCPHKRSHGKGQKIINNNHKREKALGTCALIHQVCSGLEHPEKGQDFLAAIRTEKPRYIRDQALLLKATIALYPKEILTEALEYCCANRLYSAADLKSIAEHLHGAQKQRETAKVVHRNPFSGSVPKQANIQPATSCIADYSNLF
jgi:hypothetical protein